MKQLLEMNIKRILVPTDFSNAAHNALQYAIDLAVQFGAQVDILHAFSIPVLTARGKTVLPDQDVLAANEQAAIQLLEKTKNIVSATDRVTISSKALPIYWQMDFADVVHQQPTDLIVMGATGATGLKKTFLGGNTARVIQNCPVPVLAVPEQATVPQLVKMGVAFDTLSLDQIQKLAVVGTFHRILKTGIHIFQITNEGESPIVPAALLELLPGAVYDHYEGAFESEILRLLELHDVDVMVMLSKKQGFFYNLVNGSIINRVSYDIPIPLLAIPE